MFFANGLPFACFFDFPITYSSTPNAGWSETQTKAEHCFPDEETAVYAAAFDAARAQMKAKAAGGASAASSFNVQA